MLSETEAAWNILQLVALALPAYAILIQTFIQVSPIQSDELLNNFYLSNIALFTMGPLSIAGLISTYVIFLAGYDPVISVAISVLSLTFVITPIVLVQTWRRNKKRVESETSTELGRPPKLAKSINDFFENHSWVYYLIIIIGFATGIYLILRGDNFLSWALGVLQLTFAIITGIVELVKIYDNQYNK